jgi:thioredoxin 1
MSVANVTDSTFEQEVLKADIPVLVDFWAPWCSPCMGEMPFSKQLQKEFKNKDYESERSFGV